MSSTRQLLLRRVVNSIHEAYASVFEKSLKRSLDEESSFSQCQTVLAAVVLVFGDLKDAEVEREYEVVSVASGTKSIGRKQMETCKRGSLVHDSHAEVLARRGFKRFLSMNMKNSRYFEAVESESGFMYKRLFKVLFYSSQQPCGRASMLGFNSDEDSGQLFRQTGAKYYGFLRDEKYSATADLDKDVLRVKPGRSDLPLMQRSLSLSCSDKMMLWSVIGVQGSCLIGKLVEPMYVDYLVVESTNKDAETAKKAIIEAVSPLRRIAKRMQKKEEEEESLSESKEARAKIKGIRKSILQGSQRFFVKRPRVVLIKRIIFPLNRSLNVSSKPKYLDQHIAAVMQGKLARKAEETEDDKSENYSVEKSEVLNGSTGMKWGMGEKGASLPRNFPFLSKYKLLECYKDNGIASVEETKYANVKASRESDYKQIKHRVIQMFEDSYENKQTLNDFQIEGEVERKIAKP